MIKIGILNECFFKESHLVSLRKIGNLKINLDTDSKEKAIARVKNMDIIIADMFICPLDKEVIEHANKLKLLVINSTGYDKLDLDYLTKKGVKVCNVANFSTDSVAEQVFALLLSIGRKISLAQKDNKEKPFEIFPDAPEHKKYLGFNLKDKTIGVIGTGNIGKRVCQIAQGFGMNVVAYNRSKKEIPGVQFKTLEEVLSESDVISLNIPLNNETEFLINEKTLNLMKSNVVIINTAREKIIDTEALYNALIKNKISGAGLDIIDIKDKNHPIFKLENVIILPHAAWFTKESLSNIGEIIVTNVEGFISNNFKNLIN